MLIMRQNTVYFYRKLYLYCKIWNQTQHLILKPTVWIYFYILVETVLLPAVSHTDAKGCHNSRWGSIDRAEGWLVNVSSASCTHQMHQGHNNCWMIKIYCINQVTDGTCFSCSCCWREISEMFYTSSQPRNRGCKISKIKECLCLSTAYILLFTDVVQMM